MSNQELGTSCEEVLHISPRAIQHLEAHPTIIPLLKEAVSMMTLPMDDTFCRQEIKMRKTIGKNECVKTPPINSLMNATFAIRSGRKVASRVVVGVEKPDCDILSIVARKNQDKWFLVTTYIGPLAPREPHDPTLQNDALAFQESIDFWCCHALVHDKSWSNPFEATWRQIVHNAQSHA